MKSKKEALREKRRRQQAMTRYGWIGLGVVVLAVLAYALWLGVRPAAGEEVEVMADSTHVATGSDPGPYNTDPPSSGRHYAEELDVGFYEQNDYEYPAGYLVHNLEHGYVIFWYDCSELSGSCDDLKASIRQVMERANNFKVIAYPWDSIDEPVVLTSWGRVLRMETFDPDKALDFVERNRNKSPEPNAP